MAVFMCNAFITHVVPLWLEVFFPKATTMLEMSMLSAYTQYHKQKTPQSTRLIAFLVREHGEKLFTL